MNTVELMSLLLVGVLLLVQVLGLMMLLHELLWLLLVLVLVMRLVGNRLPQLLLKASTGSFSVR